MSDNIKINVEGKELTIDEEGKKKLLKLPLSIEVAENSFLHIGAAPSPLTEKKGAVFKVDRIPVIPATSVKGALRYQLELLFIEKSNEFAKLLNLSNGEKDMLKPCIPSSKPSDAEKELINAKQYRQKHCELKADNNGIKIEEENIGICPVCYFMGATGLMGFLRFNNFYPLGESDVIDQTNIRIDRKTGTAAYGAKVEGEQVKPGTVFKGNIDIIISDPILQMQGIQFGDARKIGNKVVDKWLEKWSETDKDKKISILIEKVLLPAIRNIKELGGQKSKGAGKVIVKVDWDALK